MNTPKLKLFPPHVRAIVTALQLIFRDNKKADKVIESLFKINHKWGSHDRAFIALHVYEIVRYWRYYWFLKNSEISFDDNALWHLFGVYWLMRDNELPPWNEFEGLEKGKVVARLKVTCPFAIKESYNEDLYQIIKHENGDKCNDELRTMNQPASLVLRVNTSLISIDKLIGQLKMAKMGFTTNPALPDAIILNERINIHGLDFFKDGLVEVQDGGSQLIAPFLDVQPGMKVIDACAGAGGKTLHLANLMKNKGKIIALDTEEYKLKELMKRCKRNRVSIAEARWIENNKTIKRLEGFADRLLLDVPCSGLGVLRRNPDAKYKIDQAYINRLKIIQANILNTYTKMLKVGGQMVYATCSILPSENEKQISRFLAENKTFKLMEEKSILSSNFGFDGFYMAKLTKTS
jgi:16S rRNA (cytosine967-C5)-methyltransferase